MILNEYDASVLLKLMDADGAEFVRLVELAGLDPASDFRGADLGGVDFGNGDLAGYNFSGADLRDARLDRAKLDGAIFDGALTEGATWPASYVPGEPSTAASESGLVYDGPLAPHQSGALAAVLEAYRVGARRIIVSMPANTGEIGVIAALLAALDGSGGLRHCLLLTPHLDERDRVVERLRNAFGPDLVYSSREINTGRWVTRPKLIVETINAFTQRLKTKSKSNAMNSLTISCIVVTELFYCREWHKWLNKHYPKIAVFAFTQMSPTSRGFDATWDHFQFPAASEPATFVYTVEQAVKDGVLQPAIIQERRVRDAVPKTPDQTFPPDAIAITGLPAVISDFLPALSAIPQDGVGVLLCKSEATVEEAARLLLAGLSQQPATGGTARKIVKHTSRDSAPGMLRAAMEIAGTILVTTPGMCTRFDWGQTSFVVVLTRINDTLAQAIALPHGRRGRLSGPLVLDYIGAFEAAPITGLG